MGVDQRNIQSMCEDKVVPFFTFNSNTIDTSEFPSQTNRLQEFLHCTCFPLWADFKGSTPCSLHATVTMLFSFHEQIVRPESSAMAETMNPRSSFINSFFPPKG